MNTVGRTFLDSHSGKIGRVIAYNPDVHINHNPKAVPAYEVELAYNPRLKKEPLTIKVQND